MCGIVLMFCGRCRSDDCARRSLHVPPSILTPAQLPLGGPEPPAIVLSHVAELERAGPAQPVAIDHQDRDPRVDRELLKSAERLRHRRVRSLRDPGRAALAVDPGARTDRFRASERCCAVRVAVAAVGRWAPRAVRRDDVDRCLELEIRVAVVEAQRVLSALKRVAEVSEERCVALDPD